MANPEHVYPHLQHVYTADPDDTVPDRDKTVVITHISYGETFNLGNFRSKRVDVTGRVEDDGDPATISRAYAHLRDTAHRLAESDGGY